jgi:hypothetical protein
MMMTAAILMTWKAAQLDVIAYSCWATSEDITLQHTVVHETPAAYKYIIFPINIPYKAAG